MSGNDWWRTYLGKPWSESCDCFGWFRLWRKEIYNDDVVDSQVAGRAQIRVATTLLTEENCRNAGWAKTSSPVEGDAVFLTRGNVPHHIGMVVLSGGRIKVLHAVEGGCVTLSSAVDLIVNGWKGVGYYTPCK